VYLSENLWVYRNKLLAIDSREPAAARDDALLVKHFVLRRERDYQKVQREVEALVLLRYKRA
jgi:hypothetical protein